jgi:hypothetical protein
MHEPGSSTPPTAYAARWARSTYSTPRSTRPRYGPTYPARHAPTSPAQRVDVPSATGRRIQRYSPRTPLAMRGHTRRNRSTYPAPRADERSATGRRTQRHGRRTQHAMRGRIQRAGRRAQRHGPTYPALQSTNLARYARTYPPQPVDVPNSTGRRTQRNGSAHPPQRLDVPSAARRRTPRHGSAYPRNAPTYPAQQAVVPGATDRPTRQPDRDPAPTSDRPGTAIHAPPHNAQSPPRLGGGETATGASGRTGARPREPSGTTPGAGTARRRVQRAVPRKGATAAAPRRSRRTTQATFGVRFQASSRRPAYGHGAPPACVQAREKGSGKRHCGFSVKRCCATTARRVVSRIRRCVVTQRSGCFGGRVPPHEEEPAERES